MSFRTAWGVYVSIHEHMDVNGKPIHPERALDTPIEPMSKELLALLTAHPLLQEAQICQTTSTDGIITIMIC